MTSKNHIHTSLTSSPRHSPFMLVILAASIFSIPHTTHAADATATIHADTIIQTNSPGNLIGSNVAVWNRAECFTSPQARQWLADLGLDIMRMPGGSWSDIVFWNGNGVRDAQGNVDPTRIKDGYPDIDYGAYQQAIALNNDRTIKTDGWHGHVGVKEIHEFIQAIPGCQALVTVNAGTARPLDAAEWVKWANKDMGYNIHYWEIGNELEGTWEAGHFLPDGTELTGELYAERFREFAEAMKAVDSTIEIGGPAGGSTSTGFSEPLLRDAGEFVDFVTYHTYPLRTSMTRDEMIGLAEKDTAEGVGRLRKLIQQYQPDRADEIEIACSEWNLGLEGTIERDMFGVAWTAAFVGELFKHGVFFANHWDTFTHGQGGSLIYFQDGQLYRKGQYWAFWLWTHFMGDNLLESSLQGPGDLKLYATRNEDAVYVMAINYAVNEPAQLHVALENFNAAPKGESALLSNAQYFWNPLEENAEWTQQPLISTFDAGASFDTEIPPLAVRCFKIPSAANPELSDEAKQGDAVLDQDHGPVELRLLLEDSSYEDTAVEGWLIAMREGTSDPYPVPLPEARLAVEGPAAVNQEQLRMAESAGHFILQPNGPGEATVTATLGDATATATVALQPSVPKPHMLWEFEDTGRGRHIESHFDYTLDDSIRANQRVARVTLDNVTPDHGDRRALLILSIPEGALIQKENIRGVFFEIMTSKDLQCTDPNAAIEIVMQSPADYWMSLGRIPLPKPGQDWQKHTIEVTQPGHIKAMSQAYNVWFVLSSQQPLTGNIYIDNTGLMIR